jgi:hypothetical protein
MNAEDILIRKLTEENNSINRKELIKEFLISEIFPLTKKILWAFDEIKKVNPILSNIDNTKFINEFYERQFEFYENILKVGSLKKNKIDFSRTVLFSYHFSKYPFIANFLDTDNIKILVARNSFWIQNIFNSSNLINFRESGKFQIIKSFIKGETFFSMFDYNYQETRSIKSNFLSISSNTPIGLIELTKKYDYKLKILGVENFEITVTEIKTKDKSVQELADELNNVLSLKIINNPSDWLLWPSIDRRWDK